MMRGKSSRQLNTSSALGNEGFSLLELIISIAILAIIVGPLMSAFVVSSHSVTKSKRIADQNAAAQTVYEKIQAKPANDFFYWSRGEDKNNTSETALTEAQKQQAYFDLLDYFGCKDNGQNFRNNVCSTYGAWDLHNKDENHGDAIEFVLPEIYQNGAIKYTATVQIRAGQGLWGEGKNINGDVDKRGKQEDEGIVGDLINGKTMADLNETKFTKSMSFNNIFIQQNNDSDPDKKALSMIGKTDVITKNKRTIYIRYEKTSIPEKGADGKETGVNFINVTPVVYYLYDITYRTADGDIIRLYYDLHYNNGKVEAETKKQKNGAQVQPEKGEEAAFVDKTISPIEYYHRDSLNNLVYNDVDFYLVFNPYNDAKSNVKEEFIIDNTDGINGNTYLMKQTATENDATDYSGIVRLLENHPNDSKNFNMSVHTNLGLKKDMETPIGGTGKFIYMQFYNVKKEDAATLTNLNSDKWYVDGSNLDSFKSLIAKEASEHIYSVYIRIYDSLQFDKDKHDYSFTNGYFTEGVSASKKIEPRYTLIGLKRG